MRRVRHAARRQVDRGGCLPAARVGLHPGLPHHQGRALSRAVGDHVRRRPQLHTRRACLCPPVARLCVAPRPLPRARGVPPWHHRRLWLLLAADAFAPCGCGRRTRLARSMSAAAHAQSSGQQRCAEPDSQGSRRSGANEGRGAARRAGICTPKFSFGRTGGCGREHAVSMSQIPSGPDVVLEHLD
eukprot:3526369-Prymnesium_polylepis.1